MLTWQDTVMTDEQLEELLGEDFTTAYEGHIKEYQSIAQVQAEVSFKAGIKEVVEWVKDNLIYIALDYNGSPVLYLQTNGTKSAEKWQVKLKDWFRNNSQGGKR